MMEILTCEQRSPEWMAARIGVIGGSSIGDVVAGGTGKMRKQLMYRMAGEILSGQNYIGYQSADMIRGVEQEPEARSLYELVSGNTVEQIGMVKDGTHFGCSPDGLVASDGMIEIKCPIPSVHIEYFIDGVVPSAYRKQIQWSLGVTGRAWCDFVSYSPTVSDKPILIIRSERNEKLISELRIAADTFIAEMLEIVKKIRG